MLFKAAIAYGKIEGNAYQDTSKFAAEEQKNILERNPSRRFLRHR